MHKLIAELRRSFKVWPRKFSTFGRHAAGSLSRVGRKTEGMVYGILGKWVRG